MRRLNHCRMGRQAQIIIGTQIEHLTRCPIGPKGADMRALRAGNDALAFVQTRVPDVLQFLRHMGNKVWRMGHG